MLIVILLISFLLTNYAEKSTKNSPLFVSALTPHSAISITDDSGFSVFPGIGTKSDPYVIEGYNITTTDDKGIEISGTTKHFRIANCYITSLNAISYGIYISSIGDGTATITNNTCANNDYGIFLDSSNNNNISANTCSNNWNGIRLDSSSNNNISANTCENNDHGILLADSSNNNISANTCENNDYGIILDFSSNNNISANTCENNDYGIVLTSFSTNNFLSGNNCSNNRLYGIFLAFANNKNNSLSENICENNNYGIYLAYSSNNNSLSGNICANNDFYGIRLSSSYNNNISANTCTNNYYYGIALSQSNYTVINENFLHDNGAYGVDISSLSFNNLIYGNTFDNNSFGFTSQGCDNGVNNQWFIQLSAQGNHWSDWSGSASYSIDGSANSFDLYPSEYPLTPPIIENVTHSPSPPTNFDMITISATVSDSSGIDSVILHYRINAGGWLITSMILSTGSIYQASIGPFSVYSVISYFITATDNDPNHNEATDDNNGSYYQFVVTQGDIDPPSITNVIHAPVAPTDLETVTISATVSDSSGIQSVTLHYRVNGGVWSTVSMTLSTGSIYQVVIGPFTTGSTVEYYITATDNSLNHNEATNDNDGLYYSFSIGSSDFIGPTITDVTHAPVAPTDLETITISATVSDSSGIQSVTLHYRVNGGVWSTVSMTLSTGSIYQVVIGPFTNSSIIDFYITATDNSLNHNEATNDNIGLYYSFTVFSPVVIPEFPTLPLLFSSFLILFFSIALIFQIRRKE
ncbi:MAG: NosD domain-containing protein [Candidatus Heimdallarchaeaceae archaeon]